MVNVEVALERAVMERDVVPPVDWAVVRRGGGFGLILCSAAAALGVLDGPAFVFTLRLFAVFVGTVAAGLAVSWRPDLVKSWLLGAVVAAAATLGTPAHWDSFRLLFAVIAFVALLRAGIVALPEQHRVKVVSALIVLHFFGILLATTSPNPTPWMVDQMYRRAYEPYLRFVYLRNAYHFYSPEPGPASILVALVKTYEGEETGADGVARPKYRTQWMVLPRRSAAGPDAPSDVKDPLGVSYFRRLSLTDAISHGAPDMNYESFEKSEGRFRRQQLTLQGNNPYIPWHPNFLPLYQYRVPHPRVTRYVLPSYAQHILMNLSEKEQGRSTVKLYRVEHRTLNVEGYLGVVSKRPGDPYYPTTYLPYYYGEYGFRKDAAGETRVDLLDPQEPMLYWIVPVVERPGGTPGDPNRKDYEDYFSVHAGREFDWSQLR